MTDEPKTIVKIRITGPKWARDLVKLFYLVAGVCALIGGFFLLRLFYCSDIHDRGKLRECVVNPLTSRE